MANEWSPYKPTLAGYKQGHPGVKSYRKFLNKELGQGGQNVEQLYRERAFSDIANQERNAQDALGRSFAGRLGLNTSSGTEGALKSRLALQAPYGEANLAAGDLGRRAMMQAGTGLENSLQRQANWYSTLTAPLFQDRALDLQQQALESQNAFNLASLGGGFGDLLGGLGTGLGAGAAAGLF